MTSEQSNKNYGAIVFTGWVVGSYLATFISITMDSLLSLSKAETVMLAVSAGAIFTAISILVLLVAWTWFLKTFPTVDSPTRHGGRVEQTDRRAKLSVW